MRLKRRTGILIFALLAATGLLAFAAATPGSDQDPLVTLSYVEKRIAAVQAELKVEVEALKKSLAALAAGNSSTGTGTGTGTGSGSGTAPGAIDSAPSFEAATFPAGAQLLLGKGTELLLRRGGALVLDPTGNALPDLTDGLELAAGSAVPKNHLLLCPKEDGRGIQATTVITVMIKGKYQILQPPKE